MARDRRGTTVGSSGTGRRAADRDMQQADHDLLIEIRTRLEALITTSNDHARATAQALAEKADKGVMADLQRELTQLQTSAIQATTHAQLEVRVTTLEGENKRLQKILWIGLGVLGTIQFILGLLAFLIPLILGWIKP